METSFKRSHACAARLSAHNAAAGLHRPTPPLKTPGHSLASLGQSLVGSMLLFPWPWCTQGSVCAFQGSISQSCVSSGSSMAGLMVTSSKRACAIPQAAAPEPLFLRQSTADPLLHRGRPGTVPFSLCGVPGSWCTQGLFEPSAHSGTVQPAMKN